MLASPFARVCYIVTALALLAFAGQSSAQTGTWGQSATGTYNYSFSANWQGGNVPNGAGSTANFNTSALTGPITVNLDISPTLGNLFFDNATNNYSYTLAGSGTLTLNNSGGMPTITVNNVNMMGTTIAAALAGSQGFTKAGPGSLTLTGNNTGLTGGITVSTGSLSVTKTATANPLGNNALTLAGGNLLLGFAPVTPVTLTAASFTQNMVVPASVAGTLTGAGAYNAYITATVDGGTARTGNTWYELGSAAQPTTGLPMNTTFTSASSLATQYTLQPSNAKNVLLLNSANPGNPNGTLTFANPVQVSALSFLVSDGNGNGTLALTANLVGGGTASLGTITAPDWFGAGTTAFIANGRINNGNGTFANLNSGNPRLWEVDVPVPSGTAAIQSISIAWTGGATTNTMVFGVSGTTGTNVNTFQDFSANGLTVTANSGMALPQAGASFGAASLGANLNVLGQPSATTFVAGLGGSTLTLGATTLTANGGITNDVNTFVTAASLSDGGASRTFTKNGAGPMFVTGNSSLGSGSTVAVNGGVFTVTRTATVNQIGSAAVALGGGTLRVGLPAAVNPLSNPTGFNQAMVVPVGGNFSALYITATMDNGVGLTGNTYYELGQNTNAGATASGIVMAQTPNTNGKVTSLTYPGFQYAPQAANSATTGNYNVVMLDNANPTATMSFTGTAVSALSFLAASANGAQTLTAVVHFSDGSSLSTNPNGTPLSATVPDWFNGAPIAEVANGRLDNNNNFNNVNSGNPRLYDVILGLPLSVQSKLVTSVDFTSLATGTGRTGIFAVSGAAPAVAQTFTNAMTVTASSTVDLESTPDVTTFGPLSINGSTLSLTGLNNGALTLGATTVTGNATFNLGSTLTLTLGALNDNGTARTITKSGAGTLTLPTAATSLVAGTAFTATGGIVNLNNATAIGSAAAVTANGATINFGAAQTFASLAGNTGGIVNLNGNTLTINGSTSTSFPGVIADGTNPGGLVRAGTGRTTLTGLNTFTGGITVSSGTLATSAPGLLGNNLFTLQGTGTLSLAGIPPGTVGGFGTNGLGYTINAESPVQGTGPSVANNVATMTSSTNNQTRSIWRNIQVPTTGNFTATWTWQVTGGSAGNPADGFAFALQNDPTGVNALGGGGGSLGYQALANSVALGTSVYSGNGVGGRGIRIYTNGNPVNNASNNNGNFQAPGSVAVIGASGNTSNPINYSLTYDATAMTLAVTLTDTTANTTFSNTFSLGNTLQSIIGNPTAYIGFTDATGGLNHTGVISNFNTSFPVAAQTTYSNNVVVPSGSPTVAVKAAAGAAVLGLGSLTMAGGTTLNVATDTGSTANLAYGLNFSGTTLGGATTFNVANNGTGIGTLTLGVVGGSGSLTKGGAGTLVLAGTNSYSGGTILTTGQLNLNSAGALPTTGTFTINGGAIGNSSGGAVTLSSNATQSWAGDFTFAGPNDLNLGTGAVTLGANRQVTVSVGNLTVGGVIGDGGGGLTLTKAGPGTLTLAGANTYGGGTVIQNGTVAAASDAALGSGNVTATSSSATLNFTGTTATAKTFLMGGATISVVGGQTVTFSGAVGGAFLDGTGTFAANGSQMVSVQTTPSANVTSTNAADRFRQFDNSSTFSVASGVNSAGTSTTVNLNGFTNEGVGSVTVGAGSRIKVANFQSYGTVTLNPATVSGQFTELINTGNSALGFNGGSRTFIGTPGTTGPPFVAGVDIHGQNLVVAGGLFVNNGFVTDSNPGGGGSIIVDYGALYKGAGTTFVPVITQNGGKVQAGNSPGAAGFGRFVFGPGGVNNYVFAIDDATGTAGPSPDALGHVSGWGLVKAVQQSFGATTSSGDFVWTATPAGKLTFAIDTLVNPTTVGTDVAGPMDHFDPNSSYSWPAVRWAGTYSGPADSAALNADTAFDTSGFLNPAAGTFGWNLDPAGQTLSLVYTPTAVPEPGSAALATLGLAITGWAARRRRAPS